MACTWGSKVNGVLTVATIGVAVLIDLWGILDHKRGTMVRERKLEVFRSISIDSFR